MNIHLASGYEFLHILGQPISNRTKIEFYFQNPYPTDLEKKELVSETGLTLSQLNNWLINSRRRMVKRLLSTLEGDHANFDSRACKGGTGGVNSRYANMGKNEGLNIN